MFGCVMVICSPEGNTEADHFLLCLRKNVPRHVPFVNFTI